MGKNGKRFSLAVPTNQAVVIELSLFIPPRKRQAASEKAHLRWAAQILMFLASDFAYGLPPQI
jgi:hypothetical protein